MDWKWYEELKLSLKGKSKLNRHATRERCVQWQSRDPLSFSLFSRASPWLWAATYFVVHSRVAHEAHALRVGIIACGANITCSEKKRKKMQQWRRRKHAEAGKNKRCEGQNITRVTDSKRLFSGLVTPNLCANTLRKDKPVHGPRVKNERIATQARVAVNAPISDNIVSFWFEEWQFYAAVAHFGVQIVVAVPVWEGEQIWEREGK